jgi:hypothetical protein
LNPPLCLNLNLNLFQYLNQFPLQAQNPFLSLSLPSLHYPQTLSQNQ